MDLLQGAERTAYMERAKKAQSGLGKGLSQRKKKTLQIARHGMISDEYSRRIYPVSFSLAFNPFDLEDDSFDADVRFNMPGSATSAFIMFKSMMKEDPELLKKFARSCGVSEETFLLDDENIGKISKQEFFAVKTQRVPKVYSAPVFLTQFSDRKNTMFSVPYGSKAVMNERGDVDDNADNGLAWDLYKIESACISQQVAELVETYQPGGVNARRTEADLKAAKLALWNKKLISRPFFKYAIRYQLIVCDSQTYEPVKEVMESYRKGTLAELDVIKLAGGETCDIIKVQIGKITDIFMDFIEMGYQMPTIPKDEKSKGSYTDKINRAAVSRADSVALKNTNPDLERDRVYLEGYEENYRSYLDDPEMWNDEIIKANVREFGTISDDALLGKFQTDIGMYSDTMSNPEIKKLFTEANIDVSDLLTAELMNTLIDGKGDGKNDGVDFKAKLKEKDQQDIAQAQAGEILGVDETEEGEFDFSGLIGADVAAPTAEYKEEAAPASAPVAKEAPVDAPAEKVTPAAIDDSLDDELAALQQ